LISIPITAHDPRRTIRRPSRHRLDRCALAARINVTPGYIDALVWGKRHIPDDIAEYVMAAKAALDAIDAPIRK
jgi:hypothetical protein